MIIVLGGTLEGREIASRLGQLGHKVILTVASDYGAAMVERQSPLEVMVRKLDRNDIINMVSEFNVVAIVDATHPYAGLITRNAIEAASETNTPYLRFERKESAGFLEDTRIKRVETYQEAADIAVKPAKTAFLTIGSKNIGPFIKKALELKTRIIARVLPDAQVIEQCLAMGLPSRDIVAVQGPFSKEMNIAMLKEYRADVLVTKDSGKVGGTDTKIQAGLECNIPVVVISRPDLHVTEFAGTRGVFNDIDQIILQTEMICRKNL